jgi:hypothetical protein
MSADKIAVVCACGTKMRSVHTAMSVPCRVCGKYAYRGDELQHQAAEARALLIELAAKWCGHSGACCEIVDGEVVVTKVSCTCEPLQRRVHEYLGTFSVGGVLALRDKECR